MDELYLGETVPLQYSLPSGKKLYNRAHKAYNKGRTLDGMYGTERADAIRKRISEGLKGHPGDRKTKNCKTIVMMEDGRVERMFHSCRNVAQQFGVTPTTVSLWIAYPYRKRRKAVGKIFMPYEEWRERYGQA